LSLGFGSVLFLAVAVMIGASTPGLSAPAAPDSANQKLEALIGTLEDKDRRQVLIGDLRLMLETTKTETAAVKADGVAGVLDDVSRRVGHISQSIVAAASALLDAPDIISWGRSVYNDPERRNKLVMIVAIIIGALFAGWLTEAAMRLALRRPRARVEARAEDGVGATLVFLFARTVMDLAPIAGFAAAAYGAVTILGPAPGVRLGALALINASVLARAVVAVARMVLAPRVASLRVLPIDDATANYIFIWIRRLANLTIYGAFAIQAALLLGLPVAAHAVFLKLLGLAIGGLFIMLVLQNRRPVALWIRGGEDAILASLRRRLGDIWHVLLILYFTVCFFVWALEVPGGFEFIFRASLITIVIILGARVILAASGHLANQVFRVSDDLKTQFPEMEARVNRYLPLMEKAGQILLFILAGLGILQAWGLDILSWAASDKGRGIVGSLVTIIVIIVAAFAIWEVVSALIERYLAGKNGDSASRSQRVRTLLPLFRNVFMVAMTVMAALTILSELGINISPLLAGAGVVGLAVGFGAQTLVKDIITGLFILLEDSIAVGDVVDVAGHSGVVESLTIRTIRLRDVRGTVHTVPFSEVNSVMNLTKDFSYALMEIGVAYRENVDDVIAVIKDVGISLRDDEAVAESILEDIQVQGLDRFDDSAVIIRARIRTKPLQQWGVRRAFNKALKAKFDELGIEIPFPHQTLYFGEDKSGDAPAAPVRLLRDRAPKPAAIQPIAPKSTASQTPADGDDFFADES
jgi:small-conductance mechanosensitive channel